MRILEAFGEPISNGGQESFVMNVVTHMDLSNKTVDLLTPYYCDNEHYKNKIESLGGKIFTFNKPFLPGKSRFNICEALDDFFKKNKYDVVHVHSGSISILSIFSYYAKKWGTEKVIVHSHCSIENFTLKNKILKFVFGLLMKNNVDQYCACSRLAAKAKFTDDIVNEKVVILNNGIDLNKFKYDEFVRNKLRKNLSIDNDTFIVGHVGRFSYQKNHDFLIDIFLEIQKVIPDSKLLLIGSGELCDEIHKKVKVVGIEEKVLFVGNVNDVHNYYQIMDCFVLPSRFEGLPIVGIEAQASSLHCYVSSNITEEMNITSLVKNIDLNKSAQHWANEIVVCNKMQRGNVENDIRKARFAIENLASEVEAMYF